MIITCPYCSRIDKGNKLAEILSNGDIRIIRFQGDSSRLGLEDVNFSTIIRAKEFNLICGNCSNSVFFRQEPQVKIEFNILNAWGTIMSYYESTYIG